MDGDQNLLDFFDVVSTKNKSSHYLFQNYMVI